MLTSNFKIRNPSPFFSRIVINYESNPLGFNPIYSLFVHLFLNE
jgi:hypothetical protein